MKLGEIARIIGAAVEPEGTTHIVATDLAYDSREVPRGSLFFCLTGRRFDGHTFAQQAIDAGAVALVVERAIEADAPRLIVRSSRAAMQALAAPFYGQPSRGLVLTGVTGTNGKTTTAFMCSAIHAATGAPQGLIGTVMTRVADEITPGVRTTPESVDLQRALRRMVEAHVKWAVMEVTSEGLDAGRVEGVNFDLAVFTNLTQDHLDHHGTMEAYFAAKRRLFTDLYAERALINIDDEWGERLWNEVTIRRHSYGRSSSAEYRAEEVELGPNSSTFVLVGPGLRAKVSIRMPGPFNVTNAVAAGAAAHLQGIDDEAIIRGLASLDGVPGRFESVDLGQPFTVIVDYAHTPDSLDNVLAAARDLARGRVIAVFGCGGDRDRAKRPKMGSAAARWADRVLVTSDNPRSEDPAAIIQEIERGIASSPPPEGYALMVDRREAINAAVSEAREGDVVVIAGKGHETGQEFADRKIPFDDRLIAAEALRLAGYLSP